ncbi:MAG TPA: hypothetical protein ENI05_13255 [Porticoccus sp.]|nr:hypothetical protein [Porticoccus sp.]
MNKEAVVQSVHMDAVEVTYFAKSHGFDSVRFMIDKSLFSDSVEWGSHYLVNNFQCPDVRLHSVLFAAYQGSLCPVEEDEESFVFKYTYIPNDGFSSAREFSLRVWRHSLGGDSDPIYVLTYKNFNERR